MAANVGNGAYLVFDTVLGLPTTATYRVTQISIGGIERPAVDASHLRTIGGKEYLASQIYDAGELTVEVQHDAAIRPWLVMTNANTAQAVSIFFPVTPNSTTLQTWSAYGYATGYEAGATNDEVMNGTFTIKLHSNLS
jgi:hypothetical protein